MKSPEKKTKMNQKWKPPPPGLLKINTDGAFVQETLTGVAGASLFETTRAMSSWRELVA
jgi:hypothetical protein